MDCFRLRQGFGGQVVAGASRNDGESSGRFDRNTLFTISVDLLFTTFMRRAFTKARNATRETCAIA
ncbi:hypothetical protein [Bradyrhizobium sp. BR 1433]|uniref:hypothetical protein n=1 Tax=Bradyrhizobium sp. BR 1433 TaxID=3447967 RepID=UPI003EE54F19